MAKKKAAAKPGVERFLAPANAPRDLVENLMNSLRDCLGVEAMRHNRVGLVSMGNTEVSEKDSFSLLAGLTDGMIALFPFVPQEIAAAAEKRYYEKMRSLREEYGPEPEEWPDEALHALKSDNTLIMKFLIHRLRKKEVALAFAVQLEIGDELIFVKEPFDTSTPLASEEDIYQTTATDSSSLDMFMLVETRHWLFGADAWQTARTRRQEEFAIEVLADLHDIMEGWNSADMDVARRGFGGVMYTLIHDLVQEMKPSPIKDACLARVGNFFTPGTPVGFSVFASIATPGEITISVHGPLDFDPDNDLSSHELLDLTQKAPLVYEKIVKDAEYLREIEGHCILSEDAYPLAEKIVDEIGEAIGFPPNEPSEAE